MTLPNITIQHLDAKDKGHIHTIARWYYEEWGTPIEKTTARLANQPGPDVLFQLIAIEGNTLVGTAGLGHQINLIKVHEQFSHLKPWVALLYT